MLWKNRQFCGRIFPFPQDVILYKSMTYDDVPHIPQGRTPRGRGGSECTEKQGVYMVGVCVACAILH